MSVDYIKEAVAKHGARAVTMAIAEHADEYAGIPFSLEGTKITVHPKYKFAEIFNGEKQQEAREKDSEYRILNRWFSNSRGHWIVIWKDQEGVKYGFEAPANRAAMALELCGMSAAWDLKAEAKAIEKLCTLLNHRRFMSYMLTGSFIETSQRSGVHYVFRRCRPTIAISTRTGSSRVLCSLCLHPIGYYRGTWAGVMVPTDEVIAHLMLMRGDEHDFWKQANHHQAIMPESGL